MPRRFSNGQDRIVVKDCGEVIPFYYSNDSFFFLDQRRLPLEQIWLEAKTASDVAVIISEMVVRGAPAIGISAAMGITLAFSPKHSPIGYVDQTKSEFDKLFASAKSLLAQSRPTAINLFWALDKMQAAYLDISASIFAHGADLEVSNDRNSIQHEVYDKLLSEALRLWQEDVDGNRMMAQNGMNLIPDGGILTHCNAGALATGGWGTALGVIRKKIAARPDMVFVDETRPYLQGARLTAYELAQDGIDITLITDNMAAFFMASGKIQSVIVGADRIAANGDTANKIGTLGVAVLARYFGIPFYVAAPIATFDLETEDGRGIPIEQRKAEEVTHIGNQRITNDYPVGNPAFDVTPHDLISGIITEKGNILQPNASNIQIFMEMNQ